MVAWSTLLGGCSVSATVEKTTRSITSTSKKIARKITFSDEGLKKKIEIIGFENRSLAHGRDFQQIFQKGLTQYLRKECPAVIASAPDINDPARQLKQVPMLASGRVDNFSLAVIGRQLGLNAVVTGRLDDVRVLNEVKGILWTKDTHYLLQVLVGLEIFDTRTATRILDRSFSRKVEIDEMEYQLIQQNQNTELPELNETLTQLLEDMGAAICDALFDQRWAGYITAVNGDKISISSGGRIGLKRGDILEVYDSSQIMEGVEGERFYLPGSKVGEIKLTAVSENSATAVPIMGRDLKANSFLRLK